MNEHTLTTILSRHKIRPTQQRIAVYQYLLDHPTHPSADIIFQALVKEYPVFSRTTIYNSLKTLNEAGLVRSVNILPDEQRFDATTEDHGHFYCQECQTIYDFNLTVPVASDLCPDGFEFTQCDVFFSGTCSACKQK